MSFLSKKRKEKTMTRLIIAGSKKNEDMFWATKFLAGDAFVFLENNGLRRIVVDPLEYGRARKEAQVDAILQTGSLAKNKEDKPSLREQALLLLQKYKIKKVSVAPNFPAGTYAFLVKNGIKVLFSDPLFPEREIKTSEEIKDIVYAQRAMEEAFSVILKIIADAKVRKGKLWSGGECVTSEFLRSVFDTEMMRRNCICEETIIASGNQAADPHCLGYGPILANTPIVMDMFPRSRKNWCWSDMTRTVVKGKLSDKARAMYKAVYEAQKRAVEMVRPGIDASEIHSFVEAFFVKKGFKTGQVKDRWEGFFHSTGHGVGLEVHEPPRVSIAKDQVLKPGHVITIEPGLYYMGVGGVRIEDTVLVTKSGYRNLAKISKELIEL